MYSIFKSILICFITFSIYAFSADEWPKVSREFQQSLESKDFEKAYELNLDLIRELAKSGLIDDVSGDLPKCHKDCPGVMYFAEACSILHKGAKQMQDSLNQMVSQGFMDKETAEYLKNFAIKNLLQSFDP